MSYEFTNDWFDRSAKPMWDQFVLKHNPIKILEIGSYEGASTCYLINRLANYNKIELHAIDTWEGGIENKKGGFVEADMGAVEKRFHKNIEFAKQNAPIKPAVVVYKEFSDKVLASMLASGKQNYFDFIYVDGSHQAVDVLCDAVLAFRLLRVGGIMAFDDYNWYEQLPGGIDPIRRPKTAIDAFTMIYCRKVRIIGFDWFHQLYIEKLED